MSYKDFLVPGGIVICGFLIGWLCELLIRTVLKSLARRTKWQGDDVIIRALQGWLVALFVILALYIAFFFLPVFSQILRTLHRILLVGTILSVTAIIARTVAGFINLYGEKGKGILPSASIFANLSKVIVFILGALVVVNSLGISITPIITTLGLGGLAVALALQDTLANFFAGLHIIITRQIRTGDYIKLESGEEGYITDITWRNTTVRQLNNNVVVVPNAKLAAAVVVNYDLLDKSMAVAVPVGVSYDSDLDKVERVTLEVARKVMREVPGGVPDAEPLIRFHTFGEFSINFTVFLRVKDAISQFPVRHEFIKQLHQRYKDEGIVIPFPIRTVFLHQTGAEDDKSV
ncbi:MAG: mechanosensitive ion channel family protein [candidate division WOR-3 bacterium]|jgi:small-conductance mechanosensitive channel|nr:mechanosensitive ion channel family protein [candidate division WOR-3 bacterium]MDH7518375.1 mechanosensitive ion channel family protein [bacterium]